MYMFSVLNLNNPFVLQFYRYSLIGLSYILKFIENWWWVALPFLLLPFVLNLWLWWREELWGSKVKYTLLEMRLPKEVLRPLKAMEQVFASLWAALYDPPNNFDKWIDGKMLLSVSMEIISQGGDIHFLLRVPQAVLDTVESIIFSQYPNIEISQVDDYVKDIPLDIPNKDWQFWGSNLKTAKDDIYPIKTYTKFFEEKQDIAKEQKRLDPLVVLLEGMTKIKKGERIWVQIITTPVTNEENNYVDRGKDKVDELVKRAKKQPEDKSILAKSSDLLIKAIPPSGLPKKEENPNYPEMQLTKGEKETVSAIESKISKPAFTCSIRFIYLARRDIFFKPRVTVVTSFLNQFSSTDLNTFLLTEKTSVSKSLFFPKNIFREGKIYLKQRSFWFHYIHRWPTGFPLSDGSFILNTEELATLYHFPGRELAPIPSLPRVEAKKGGAPSNLPVE